MHLLIHNRFQKCPIRQTIAHTRYYPNRSQLQERMFSNSLSEI